MTKSKLIKIIICITLIYAVAIFTRISMNSRVERSHNAAIKYNLSNVRVSADHFFVSRNIPFANFCKDKDITKSIIMAIKIGGDKGTLDQRCNSSTDAWAVNVLLHDPEFENIYYCVDSTGASKDEKTELSGSTKCL